MAVKKKSSKPVIEQVKTASRNTLTWRIHTPNLLKEIVENGGPSIAIMNKPINILGKVLYQVGQRARQLDDPTLNALLLQLTIYENGDPDVEGYDAQQVRDYLDKYLPR